MKERFIFTSVMWDLIIAAVLLTILSYGCDVQGLSFS